MNGVIVELNGDAFLCTKLGAKLLRLVREKTN